VTAVESTRLPETIALEPNRVELSPMSFLERAAVAFGDRTAVIDGARRFTYREFRDRVDRLASALGGVGVRPGDRVAVLAPNGHELLECHFGVPLAGAVLVAINTRLSPDEIVAIVRQAGAKVLVVDYELYPRVAGLIEQCERVETVVTIEPHDPAEAAHGELPYEAFLGAPRTIEAQSFARLEDDAISINYTSGTTGSPKGAVYTHRGAFLNALSVAFEAGLSPASVYLWTLPMFHCNGWSFTWGAVAAGATHVVVRKVDPDVVWRLIGQERVTHLCAAPTVLIALANQPARRHLASQGALVRVLTGGSPPSPTTIAQMAELGIDVVHLYGMTETYGPSLSCAWWPEWNDLPLAEQARLKARQGVPTVAVGNARVVDADLVDVPPDGETMGELVVRSNTVMREYFEDSVATTEAFAGGWFHTGDLGVVHPDGYVELRDRAKDIIISGGENISTVQVEQVLLLHPAVLEAAVVGVPDDKWGEVPKAYLRLKPGVTVSEKDVIAFCRQHIAGFKVPKLVEFADLPKTGTGKIQKHILRARDRA
jgi:fatty-acyl-CoA synthase